MSAVVIILVVLVAAVLGVIIAASVGAFDKKPIVDQPISTVPDIIRIDDVKLLDEGEMEQEMMPQFDQELIPQLGSNIIPQLGSQPEPSTQELDQELDQDFVDTKTQELRTEA